MFVNHLFNGLYGESSGAETCLSRLRFRIHIFGLFHYTTLRIEKTWTDRTGPNRATPSRSCVGRTHRGNI